MSTRWIFYSIMSGSGVIITVQGDKPNPLAAAEQWARTYRRVSTPAEGDKFRLQRIPAHDEVEESIDYIYREPKHARMDLLDPQEEKR
jgi:hypothetical protein